MTPRRLPEWAHRLFDEKGPENAARVRRVVQLVSAIHARPLDWRGLRVLDLGCGEGLFAIEAACHGADVLAVDGRAQRMARGRELAGELSLGNLRFVQADVRTFAFEEEGPFDVVLLLGLLYHLDAPDLFHVMRRVAGATLRTLVIETHLAPEALETATYEGRPYRGWRYREHRAADDARAREARLLGSLDSEWSFWLTPESLDRLLREIGFPTVLQCRAPPQPAEAADRATFVALKGGRPDLVSFPWIDGAAEDVVRERTRAPARSAPMPPIGTARERARAGAVIALGDWARTHCEFVFGSGDDGAPDAALWRRDDLERYVGGLRRVPPLLAVLVGAEGEDEVHRRAADLLAAGAGAVWLVLPAAASVLVVARGSTQTFGPGDRLPEPSGLAGLTPAVTELIGQAPDS